MNAYEHLAKWYKRVTWFGVVLNLLFVFPLLFAPAFIINLLGLDAEPNIWVRFSGGLLLILSIFYIPASIDLKRYRIHAWLAIFPSRIFTAALFAIAVFIFNYPFGYILGVFVDLPIFLIQLIILLNIVRVERGHAPFGKLVNYGSVTVVFGALAGLVLWHAAFRDHPQQLRLAIDSDKEIVNQELFKYGSIGAENQNGIPYWIWWALPRMFPQHLPGPGGYASLGIPWEPGRDTPIGFTKKRIGITDRVAFNCALCHTATVRLSADDSPRIELGGAAHTFDALAFERFLFKSAYDEKFTASDILSEISKVKELPLLEKLLYRFVLIPFTRKALIEQAKEFDWLIDIRAKNTKDEYKLPEWGPGRIDPFNPVKRHLLSKIDPKADVGKTLGNSDMVPIWNLRRRKEKGMAYHWDGLNKDLTEVVRSSAIGDGATPKTMNKELVKRLKDLEDWLLDLRYPAYPFPIDTKHADQGKTIYETYCARCHAFDGEYTGKVPKIDIAAAKNSEEPNTDEERTRMWTKEAAQAYNSYAKNYEWKFNNFRSTGRYVNVPLDALWIRAPYLHNGSVPSLTDLLKKPAPEGRDGDEYRPRKFYRGNDIYDPVLVGFMSRDAVDKKTGRKFFGFDTDERGNSNKGHLYGTDLNPGEKRALIEFLKTL